MLFDLRSRGRRRTVQVVYLGLALLMGGSLVFLGVGTGNGFGGLLDAFKGGSGGGGAVTAQETNALKRTKLHPDDPQAWVALFQARYTSAGQGSNYNPNVVNQATGQTGGFTTAGRQELTRATQAWTHYVSLAKTPDGDVAQLAARAYNALGDSAGEARTWQIVTAANPSLPIYFEYLAASAYRAKENRLGDLAAGRALALTPKADQTILKQQLQQAKSAAAGTAGTGVSTGSAAGTTGTAAGTAGAAGAGTGAAGTSGAAGAAQPAPAGKPVTPTKKP